MDRRDYNDEERERFNNEGGGYIPRRRFNFSRSDYQNLDPSQLQGNANSGDYSAPSYSQPYSQANYQPNPMPSQYPHQQPYTQQGYVVPQQPYAPQQPQYVQYSQPMGNMGQPMSGFSQDNGGFAPISMPPQMGKKKGWFSRGKKQPQFEGGDMQNILIVTPKTLSEVQDIIDNLRNRQAIIVEFNRINEKYAQRILDFLNGAIYALGGCEQRIGDNMFLFTPGGVSIQGQIK